MTPTPSLIDADDTTNNTHSHSRSDNLHLLDVDPTLPCLRLFLQIRARLFNSWMSIWLRVSLSGLGLLVLVVEVLRLLDADFKGFDVHGSGCCMARNPETKHPPYA
jgi:hypothetical protein